MSASIMELYEKSKETTEVNINYACWINAGMILLVLILPLLDLFFQHRHKDIQDTYVEEDKHCKPLQQSDRQGDGSPESEEIHLISKDSKVTESEKSFRQVNISQMYNFSCLFVCI